MEGPGRGGGGTYLFIMATLCLSSSILSTLLLPSSTAKHSIATRFSYSFAALLSAALRIHWMPKRVR